MKKQSEVIVIKIVRECPLCYNVSEVEVSPEGYAKYANGELCQDAFPELSATEREIIISGLCPDCQNTIFGCPEGEDE